MTKKTIHMLMEEAYKSGFNDALKAITKEISDLKYIVPKKPVTNVLADPSKRTVDLRTLVANISKSRYESLAEQLKVETKPCYFCQGEGILQSGEECSCFTAES